LRQFSEGNEKDSASWPLFFRSGTVLASAVAGPQMLASSSLRRSLNQHPQLGFPLFFWLKLSRCLQPTQ
jgi:hypothetical protein